MLEINGIFKVSYSVEYGEGYIYRNGENSYISAVFRGVNQEDLIQEVCSFLCITNKKYECILNACGEVGRIDFKCFENSKGDIPTAEQIQGWKLHKVELWSVTYECKVEQVYRSDFKLVE